MPASLQLNSGDRVLVLAPHPDDESIACSGLLLAARDAGAARSVIVVTDGDNNPWPQRWIEKRWRIDASARARWGARRRAEAQIALDVLGVDREQRHFLGLPDSELTALLMRGELAAQLLARIERFQPTHLALPALADEHPDHSAVHVAARLALSRTSVRPKLLIYAVHGDQGGTRAAVVALGERQQGAKRDAILAHQTQMRLSGGRFLRFAGATESYAASVGQKRPMPLVARISDDCVEVRVERTKLRDAVRKLQLLVLLDGTGNEEVRLRLPVAEAGDAVEVESFADMPVPRLQWQAAGDSLVLRILLPRRYGLGFVKLEKRRPGLVIYDRYGWQSAENSRIGLGEI